MLLPPTGVAAINIDGTTIHSGLNIPLHGEMSPLNDKNWALLRNKYSDFHFIIIDEISMVPSKLVFQVHQRLIKIFESLSNIPIAGKSFIICGDFLSANPSQSQTIGTRWWQFWIYGVTLKLLRLLKSYVRKMMQILFIC